MYRIGYSEDIHQIVNGDRVVLGGVSIECGFSLKGHSDADVVLHAVAESILGALSLGDLGDHFPDNDPKYKGIASSLLVNHVVSLMKEKGYHVGNIDVQVACLKPKLSSYKLGMRKNIASLLGINVENVSVKAMSFNEVGPIGKGEAIKASVVVLLENN